MAAPLREDFDEAQIENIHKVNYFFWKIELYFLHHFSLGSIRNANNKCNNFLKGRIRKSGYKSNCKTTNKSRRMVMCLS